MRRTKKKKQQQYVSNRIERVGGSLYMQGSFQTGVYSVRNVHNELLQLFRYWLDSGSAVCSNDRKEPFCQRTVGFVLIRAMGLEPESTRLTQKKRKHEKTIQKKRLRAATIEEYQLKEWRLLLCSGILLGAVSFWLGIASLFY